jgi:hypothetical protein
MAVARSVWTQAALPGRRLTPVLKGQPPQAFPEGDL